MPHAGCAQMLKAAFLLRGRTGGLTTQLIAALAHASAHILTAVVSLVLLELGVETCIRYTTPAIGILFQKACAVALDPSRLTVPLLMRWCLRALALLMEA